MSTSELVNITDSFYADKKLVRNSDTARKLMRINDAPLDSSGKIIDDETREKLIIEEFAKLGIEVEFTE